MCVSNPIAGTSVESIARFGRRLPAMGREQLARVSGRTGGDEGAIMFDKGVWDGCELARARWVSLAIRPAWVCVCRVGGPRPCEGLVPIVAYKQI